MKDKKVQDGRTQVLANKESSKEGNPIRGIGTNQVLEPRNPPPIRVVKSISYNEKGKTLKITPNFENLHLQQQYVLK